MKSKKIIGFFLVLVFVLQLLPIKQAIHYFMVDNITVEEVIDTEKAPEKSNSKSDESHFLNDHHFLLHPYLPLRNVMMGLYHPMIPSSHADDIETPPPNFS